MTGKLAFPSLLCALVLSAGCASAPTEEIAAAETAMEDARSAEAQVYAPEAWVAAAESHAQMEAEMKAQEERLFITKSYADAKRLATETEQLAEDAATDAIAGKESARAEARQILDEATALYVEVQDLLERAPSGKGTRADLAVLRADATSTEQLLQQAERAFEDGHYMDAQTKAESIVQALNEVKAELEAARQATA